VTCTGSITITGTATNTPTSVTWAASPSGASGSCTGTDSYSCAVAVAPDAAGEGVETITITATNAFGSNTDTETVGFYVNGAHSCFSAQNIDGSFNSTLADNDPISTWENLGSSALDVTQGTAGARPTYIANSTTINQPVVSTDGGDSVASSADVTNWNFLHQADTVSVYHVGLLSTSAAGIPVRNMSSLSGTNGIYFYTLASTTRMGARIRETTTIYDGNDTTTVSIGPWEDFVYVKKHNGTAYTLDYTRNNAATVNTTGVANAASVTNGQTALSMLSSTVGLTFQIQIYQSELSPTQIGINNAVTEWALDGTLPVVP
jgi:hypothetical protein